MVDRVSATPQALDLIARLTARHGPLLFHQSGGCCDGSAPMCYPAGEFRIGAHDVRLGEIGGAPVYMSGSQFEYWQHTHLTIDVGHYPGGHAVIAALANDDLGVYRGKLEERLSFIWLISPLRDLVVQVVQVVPLANVR